MAETINNHTVTFERLLIANRAEIACRIIRTANRLGIHTTAVYSDVDHSALHVQMADNAVAIGPAPANESYLSIEKIIAAALQSGCQAIHPGYGFLSENADFARACDEAGIIFVGPTAAAMDAMASKSAAKQLMHNAGVPVLPGYHGSEQDTQTLQQEADKTGYPIMLKASAGGGGKGMRIVRSSSEFADALQSVKREASASFADDRVLLERYVEKPRHIEIQVFSDTHDNHLHLFERDCSIQRRHQKVLEEAPAPKLDPEQRRIMGDAAVNAARAIDYRGAGTVEFIADQDGHFYFMEMNTRLQVEHPVTEMITGQDLVEWQLTVAAGASLPLKQDELFITGHAIEARIYAEDPINQFLPASGKLERLDFPAAHNNLRVETGVVEGDTVSVFYDPMIAKLVAFGVDRNQARQAMLRALTDTVIVGPSTNVQYLRYLVSQPDYISGNLDTGFIERLPDTAPCQQPIALYPWIIAAAIWRQSQSPGGGWRLNQPARNRGYWRCNTNTLMLSLQETDDGYLATIDCENESLEWQVNSVQIRGTRIVACINATEYCAHVSSGRSNQHDLHSDHTGPETSVQAMRTQSNNKPGNERFGVVPVATTDHPLSPVALDIERLDTASFDYASSSDNSSLLAPMPGKIISVSVKAGDTVCEGDALMIVEAMKMEHTISAPRDGVIEEIHFAENDTVPGQAALLKLQKQ